MAKCLVKEFGIRTRCCTGPTPRVVGKGIGLEGSGGFSFIPAGFPLFPDGVSLKSGSIRIWSNRECVDISGSYVRIIIYIQNIVLTLTGFSLPMTTYILSTYY